MSAPKSRPRSHAGTAATGAAKESNGRGGCIDQPLLSTVDCTAAIRHLDFTSARSGSFTNYTPRRCAPHRAQATWQSRSPAKRIFEAESSAGFSREAMRVAVRRVPCRGFCKAAFFSDAPLRAVCRDCHRRQESADAVDFGLAVWAQTLRGLLCHEID